MWGRVRGRAERARHRGSASAEHARVAAVRRCHSPWAGGVPSAFPTSSHPASFHAVRPHTLGVIGLGAIGGSVALQAKRAGIARVLGWSPEPAERAAAARQGAIDDAPPHAADVPHAADLLALAAPPPANLPLPEPLHAALPPRPIPTHPPSSNLTRVP